MSGAVVDKYGSSSRNVARPYKLDVNSWTWTTLDSFPFHVTNGPFSFDMNGEWYFGAGANIFPERYSKEMYKYNPGLATWTKLADFPGKFHIRSTGFSVNGKGYVFLGNIAYGFPSPTYEQELWEYDPGTDRWAQVILPDPYTLPKGDKFQIITYGSKAYFLSGEFKDEYNAFEIENPCVEFDPVAKTLKKINNNQTAGVMQLIYQNDKSFYFHSDALGYITSMPNITTRLVID